MPKRAAPQLEGKPGPRPPEERTGGSQFDPGRHGLVVSLHPWLALTQSSAWLPAPSSSTQRGPKKKRKQHPGNSIWSRNLQGPWFQEASKAVGEGQRKQRVGPAPEELDLGREKDWSSGSLRKQAGEGTHPPALQPC